jgi:hypothetical protein
MMELKKSLKGGNDMKFNEMSREIMILVLDLCTINAEKSTTFTDDELAPPELLAKADIVNEYLEKMESMYADLFTRLNEEKKANYKLKKDLKQLRAK